MIRHKIMEVEKKIKWYSEREENLNIRSHAIGIVLSVIGTILLWIKSNGFEEPNKSISFLVFGVSMILLYTASTVYHIATDSHKRRRLRVFDHASIYILIAGTYTPFTLLVIAPHSGMWLFYAVWGVAISGVTLKLFFTGKYDILSTVMYVVMGWLAVFEFSTLMDHLDPRGLKFLLAGGIIYTVGAILYSIKSIPYNHFIFHLFVLGGTISHFIAVYYYL